MTGSFITESDFDRLIKNVCVFPSDVIEEFKEGVPLAVSYSNEMFGLVLPSSMIQDLNKGLFAPGSWEEACKCFGAANCASGDEWFEISRSADLWLRVEATLEGNLYVRLFFAVPEPRRFYFRRVHVDELYVNPHLPNPELLAVRDLDENPLTERVGSKLGAICRPKKPEDTHIFRILKSLHRQEV